MRREFIYSKTSDKLISISRIIEIDFDTAFPDEYAYVTYGTDEDGAMVWVSKSELAKAGLVP